MERLTWAEAAVRSKSGVAFRREQTDLFFVHPVLDAHFGLMVSGHFCKMRLRDSLLKDDWMPLDMDSGEGLRFLQALIGGFNDLVEI